MAVLSLEKGVRAMKSQRIAALLLMLFLLAGCTGETNPMPQSGTPETLTAPVQEIPATDPTWSTVPETQPQGAGKTCAENLQGDRRQ